MTSPSTGTYTLQDAEEDIANLQNQISVGPNTEAPFFTTPLIVGYATPNPRGPYFESFETGIGDFTGQGGAALSQSNAFASDGSFSLLLTANGTGAPQATGPLQKCSPNDPISLSIDMHAGATALPHAFIAIAFFDEGGVSLGQTDSVISAISANTTVTYRVQATSPVDTGWYAVVAGDNNTDANGVQIFVDNILASGNVVYSISSTSTTDSVGNQINQGFWINNGVILQYGTTSQGFVPLTGASNWLCPSGVTTVTSSCYGASGSGFAGSSSLGGAGGGGGEYAQQTVGVTSGNSYAYSCATHASGAATTFTGDSAVTVSAACGGNATAVNAVGFGGNTSTNAIHYPGGNGAISFSTAGGGGGGGAGASGPGKNGQGQIGGLGGPGGIIVPGGGSGGNGGGAGGHAGGTGSSPGGAGGGGGSGSGPGGVGVNGKIFLYYVSTGGVSNLFNSMSPVNGTDPSTGIAYNAGIWNYLPSFGTAAGFASGGLNLVSGVGSNFTKDGGGLPVTGGSLDSNEYDMTRYSKITTASLSITAVNTAFQNCNPASGPGLFVNVGVGRYIIEITLRYAEAAANVPRFQIAGPTVSVMSTEFTAQAQTTNGATGQSASNGSNAFSSPLSGPTMTGTNTIMRLRAKFITTASGTVQLQANTSVGGSNFTINAGAEISVYPCLNP